MLVNGLIHVGGLCEILLGLRIETAPPRDGREFFARQDEKTGNKNRLRYVPFFIGRGLE